MKIDWKKTEKSVYLPGTKPEYIDVPSFKFFAVKGAGDPNGEEFQGYVRALYALAYAVRMSPKSGAAPVGYFEYSVYPLEGLWDISDEAKKGSGYSASDKSALVFDLMIRQPDFVDEDFALEIIERVRAKKRLETLSAVRFESIEEGPCVQMTHLGPYDDEPASFARMEEFCASSGMSRAEKTHREIYLSNPERTVASKMRTTLRFKVVGPQPGRGGQSG